MEITDVFAIDMGTEEKLDRMPFGKYVGHKFSEIPDSYLVWLHKNVNMGVALENSVRGEMINRFVDSVTEYKSGYSYCADVDSIDPYDY